MSHPLVALHGWASHTAAIDLRIVEPLDCPRCGARRSRHLWYMYEYCTMGWIFGIVSRRIGYVLSCASCRWSESVPEEEGEGRRTVEPRIPFLRRYGLGLVLVLPLAGAAVYFISEFARLAW
jgi:hypothetical protein